ncbi:CopG family transcriptional regulator [bacterium]|nr:CopG family transcriptional regulator [bacterium]
MAKTMTMIRMDESIKKKLKELAETENRSLSNFIINATLEYVKVHYDKEITIKKPK